MLLKERLFPVFWHSEEFFEEAFMKTTLPHLNKNK